MTPNLVGIGMTIFVYGLTTLWFLKTCLPVNNVCFRKSHINSSTKYY